MSKRTEWEKRRREGGHYANWLKVPEMLQEIDALYLEIDKLKLQIEALQSDIEHLRSSQRINSAGTKNLEG